MENRVLLTAIKKALDDGWVDHAACRDMSPDVFFVDEIEDDDERTHAEVAAKTICASCSVLVNCQAYALSVGERHGIIGGMTEDERARARRRRGKNVVAIVIPLVDDDAPVCGTSRGYSEHRHRGEPPCGKCKRARAEPLLRYRAMATT